MMGRGKVEAFEVVERWSSVWSAWWAVAALAGRIEDGGKVVFYGTRT